MKKILSFLLIISLMGCGITSSLNKENLVKYVLVNVSDDLKITGRLLEENENSITIAIDGVSQKYLKSEIKGFEIIKLPEERLMMEDVVRNSKWIASNTGFFVILSIVSIIAIVASSSSK